MALSNRSLLRAIEENEDNDELLDMEEQAFKLLEQDELNEEEESKSDLKEELLLELEFAELDDVEEMLLMDDEIDEDKLSPSDEVQAKAILKVEGTPTSNGIGARTGDSGGGPTITDKEFYKAMQKLKDRGTNAVPPKKSASAYILFGKEVSKL